MSKKYTIQARTCIKGEAFFESLIAEYAIPHHVVGPKDLGADYICEWAYGDSPSGFLFTAQVKAYTVTEPTKPRKVADTHKNYNKLESFKIRNSNLSITNETIDYWRRLELPAYLFAVACTPGGDSKDDTIDLYYKRFTPVLTLNTKQEKEQYFKVNKGQKFRAFADEKQQRWGFARDLFIDLMRWSYYKGTIAWIKPSRLGLKQWTEEYNRFPELITQYHEQIKETYRRTKPYLDTIKL